MRFAPSGSGVMDGQAWEWELDLAPRAPGATRDQLVLHDHAPYPSRFTAWLTNRAVHAARDALLAKLASALAEESRDGIGR